MIDSLPPLPPLQKGQMPVTIDSIVYDSPYYKVYVYPSPSIEYLIFTHPIIEGINDTLYIEIPRKKIKI